MCKIIFIIGSQFQKVIRWGEVGPLFHAAYFRAKDLGYEDNEIYFEWPLRVASDSLAKQGEYVSCPKESIFPFNFIEKRDVVIEDYEVVIDFLEKDSFFQGSMPIQENRIPPLGQRNYTSPYEYLNRRWYHMGERSVFDIPKDKLEKPYILFHYREADWSTYRNVDPRTTQNLLEIFKEKYGDKYQYFKTGERQRILDRLFDFVAPNYKYEPDKFFRLINNASFMVCAESGPNAYAQMFNIPTLEYDVVEHGKNDMDGCHTPGWWKAVGGLTGETTDDWLDKSRYMMIWKNHPIEKEQLLEFAGRFLDG